MASEICGVRVRKIDREDRLRYQCGLEACDAAGAALHFSFQILKDSSDFVGA